MPRDNAHNVFLYAPPNLHRPSLPPAVSAFSSDSSSTSYSHSPALTPSDPSSSRPSTASGAALNAKMHQLAVHPHHPRAPPSSKRYPVSPPSTLTAPRAGAVTAPKFAYAPPSIRAFPPVQPSWPPVVIQLEEAPQEQDELDAMVKTDVDTFDTRMSRIQMWRSNAASIPDPEVIRPGSMRRRSANKVETKPITQFRCPACDASYSSRQSLKRHAQGVRTNPACRSAVEYDLE